MKYASIAYFVILFAIMGSYLAFSIPDNAQRLHIATASTLSGTQHNKMLVFARDLNTGSRFEGYSVETRWIQADLTPVPGVEPVREKLPENGEAVISMPAIPLSETAGLEVRQFDSRGELRKSGVVPSTTFVPQPPVQQLNTAEPKDSFFAAVVPAAFMFNQPNEVFIAMFSHGEPWSGTMKIEQTFGPRADFLPEIAVNGMGRVKIAIASASDFRLTADDREYYVTFVPNEKPIHAAIDLPVMTPERSPVLSVTPVGTMPDITVDYFDEDAWIGRQVIPARQAQRAELALDYVYGDAPSLFYARVSGSSFGTPDSSQTIPIIASKEPLTEAKQAAYAIRTLERWPAQHPETAYLSNLLKQSRKAAPMIRDYALALAATHHAPAIEMRVRTASAEQQAFERQKSEQKSFMNVILVIWFGLGLAASGAMIIRGYRRRRKVWDEIIASGTAEAGQIPPQTTGLTLLILLVLFIGFMLSLYFMMQIL